MDRTETTQRIALRYEQADRASAKSVRDYMDNVVIESRPEPARFGDVADDWQYEVYGPIWPALEDVSGVRKGYTGPRNFMRTLSRGSDKTGMIGRLLNWLLAYSKKRLSISVAAGDSDQAKLITENMFNELQLNPWLASHVEWGQKVLRGPGGELRVLTADAATSFGRTDDVIVCDELTHWGSDALWKVLWSGSVKRPNSVFIIISNAGTKGSWQWDIRCSNLEDSRWSVYEAPGPLASWMSPEAIASMRSKLPRGFARRVIDNVWIDPAEDADFLARVEIEACEGLARRLQLVYQACGVRGIRYVAGIDYGPRRDRTALSVVHLGSNSLCLVDRLDVWQGRPDYPIAIERVEDWIRDINHLFHNPLLVIDPYQMEGTIQEFEGRQQVERYEARGGKRTYELAEHLRTLVSNQRLVWYPEAGSLPVAGRIESLGDELLGLVLKQTPYGYRFDHTAAFHDDRCVSVGMAALMAARMDPSGPGVPPPVLTKPEVDLTRPFRDWTRRGLWGVLQPESR